MKHTKIITAALLALALTACSDTNTAEEASMTDVPADNTVLSEETTSAEETTTADAAETETETDTETENTETEPLDISEIDITVPHKLSAGKYDAECTISTSVWGSDIEFTNNQNALLSSFLTYHNADELQEIISSGSERLMEEDAPDFVKASLDDFYFFDCDGDGEEEMLTVLELHDINNGFLNSYAVYYVDNSAVSFVSDGVHRHRSVFFTAVASQTFIIFAEIPGMGYSVDPVIEAEKAFTFSNGGFVPYDPPEGKSLCVRVGENDSRLYLFNTDENNDTEYYYMDEIAAGDVEQTLGWVNGELKVIDGFEAE